MCHSFQRGLPPRVNFGSLLFACWNNLPKSVGQLVFGAGVRGLSTTSRHITLLSPFLKQIFFFWNPWKQTWVHVSPSLPPISPVRGLQEKMTPFGMELHMWLADDSKKLKEEIWWALQELWPQMLPNAEEVSQQITENVGKMQQCLLS